MKLFYREPICSTALFVLATGTAFAQETGPKQVLLFKDTFEVSESSLDMSFENEKRQSGELAPLDYADTATEEAEELSELGSEYAPGKLSFFPEPGFREWLAVSPNHNFVHGSPFSIEFEINAGVDNGDSGDWAAIVFGATSQNTFVNASDGMGILFRNNGDIQVFDGTASIYSGNGGFIGGIPMDDLEVRIEVSVDGFDGNSPATVRMFINDESVVITGGNATEHVKATGFRANYITLLGAAWDGNWHHTFDDFTFSAVPGIAVAPTQLNAIVGETAGEITVSIPRALIDQGPVEVTAQSLTPGIVSVDGAGDDGRLVLNFTDANQAEVGFRINATGTGVGKVQLYSPQASFLSNTIIVMVASGVGIEEIVFSDTFETSTEDWDINYENDQGRQSGTAGILDYVEAEASAAGGGADEFTVVNPDWAEGKLYIVEQNVSPDYNFIDGPEFTISVKIYPGFNNDFHDSSDWAAVVFGATQKNRFVNASNGMGILFRNSRQIEVWDGSSRVYGTPSDDLLPEGELDIKISSSSINFSGAPATIRLSVNDEQVALTSSSMEYTKESGFHANHISLLGIGQDMEHTFDDFNVEAKACVSVTASRTELGPGDTATEITVKVPVGMIKNEDAVITVTSSDPSVAIPDGNADGNLQLTFAKGGPNIRSIDVEVLGSGRAIFSLSTGSGVCIGDPVAVTKRAAFVMNPSFEDHPPAEKWPHYGPVGSWSGGSGVNIGGPFNDNGATPDRNQVAFSQGSRALSQVISGFKPENQYWLQFFYNTRNCCGGSSMNLVVELDGEELLRDEVVKSVGGANAYHSKTLVFSAESDSGELIFRGEAQGDATLIYDAISIVEREDGNVILMNPSFEASGTPPWPGYIQPKPIAGWNASGNYGVNFAGAGPFADNGKAEDQDLVAFLQGNSSLSQEVSGLVPGESYELRFVCNARTGNSPTLLVKANDEVLLEETIEAVGGATPYHVKTTRFKAATSSKTLSFSQTAEGDQTVLLDNVMLKGASSNLPCITASTANLSLTVGQTGTIVSLTIPEELVSEEDAVITVTSSDPGVVNPAGGTDGRLDLKFTVDDELTKSFEVAAIGKGVAALVFSNQYGVCFNPASVEVSVSASFINNPSFEDHPPSAAWPHYGPVGAWESGSGVNNASGPFQDNGVIPDRSQIAFSQGSRILKQLVGGLEGGQQYWLQFYYNTRNCCGGTIDLAVLFDDEELDYISEILPVGGEEPYYFYHVEFTPENASGELAFESITAGDATLLLDAVSLTKRDENNLVLVNPGFEASGTPAWPGYIQPAPIVGWMATGNYGVNASGPGPFADNGSNPEQDRVAFLQGQATLSQIVEGLEHGEVYHLSFAFNARGGNQPNLKVTLDEEVALDYQVTPVGGTEDYYFYAHTFTAETDWVEITFAQTAEGDNTVLLDDVRVVDGKGPKVELPSPTAPVEPIAVKIGAGADAALKLSWPADATGWVVQFAESVIGPWKDADAQPAVEGELQVVPITPGKRGSRFYRLIHP